MTATPAARQFRRILLGMACLIIATAIWLPLVHFIFKPGKDQMRSATNISPQA